MYNLWAGDIYIVGKYRQQLYQCKRELLCRHNRFNNSVSENMSGQHDIRRGVGCQDRLQDYMRSGLYVGSQRVGVQCLHRGILLCIKGDV